MSLEQTSLDEIRAEYVRQIIAAARANGESDYAHARVDHLVMEWGAKAYRQGQTSMAERVKQFAEEWIGAVRR